MRPFNQTEVQAVQNLKTMQQNFDRQLEDLIPKEKEKIETKYVRGGKETGAVSTREVDSRLTTHLRAYKREIQKLNRIMDGWLNEPLTAAKQGEVK